MDTTCGLNTVEYLLGQGNTNTLTSLRLDNTQNKFSIKHIAIERFTTTSMGKVGINNTDPSKTI